MCFLVLQALNDCYAMATAVVGREIFLKPDFLPTVISLLSCPSVRLRLQALWAIGNAGYCRGNDGLKDEILSLKLVDAINQVNIYIYINECTTVS